MFSQFFFFSFNKREHIIIVKGYIRIGFHNVAMTCFKYKYLEYTYSNDVGIGFFIIYHYTYSVETINKQIILQFIADFLPCFMSF